MISGSRLLTFEHQGEKWVALRSVVEDMGVSWQGQQAKLAADRDRFNHQGILTVGADGKQREMLCIPLRRFPAWLYGINAAKLPNPAVRQRVELYQAASRLTPTSPSRCSPPGSPS